MQLTAWLTDVRFILTEGGGRGASTTATPTDRALQTAAGIYLLVAGTLFASVYIVPEHLYPWLSAVFSVLITGLDIYLYHGARNE